MTEQHDSYDLEGEIASNPRLEAELAVAEMQLRMEQLLEQAVDAAASVDFERIAEVLEVSVDRVARVLDGIDAPRLESFVRYVTLLGFTPELRLAATSNAAGSNSGVVDHYSQVGANDSGTFSIQWHREAPSLDVEGMSELTYEGTTVGHNTFVDLSRIERGAPYNLSRPRAKHRTGGHAHV